MANPMENLNNSGQQRVDEYSGGPLEGMSPQNTNVPQNNEELDEVVYTGLGINGHPDSMNPGDDEAADTLLFTDTATARHATDEVSNDDLDDLPKDLLSGELTDDELDQEITELAEEEDAADEPY
jgi:hypothetical protein